MQKALKSWVHKTSVSYVFKSYFSAVLLWFALKFFHLIRETILFILMNLVASRRAENFFANASFHIRDIRREYFISAMVAFFFGAFMLWFGFLKTIIWTKDSFAATKFQFFYILFICTVITSHRYLYFGFFLGLF